LLDSRLVDPGSTLIYVGAYMGVGSGGQGAVATPPGFSYMVQI